MIYKKLSNWIGYVDKLIEKAKNNNFAHSKTLNPIFQDDQVEIRFVQASKKWNKKNKLVYFYQNVALSWFILSTFNLKNWVQLFLYLYLHL